MTLERRVEALATTVAQQQATIVQMQAEIAGMKEAGGPGKVVIAAQNQAASINKGENRVSPSFSGVFSVLQ